MKKLHLLVLLPIWLLPSKISANVVELIEGASVLLIVDGQNYESDDNDNLSVWYEGTIIGDSIDMTINDVMYDRFEQDTDGRIWLENVQIFVTLRCNSDSIRFLYTIDNDEQTYPSIRYFSPRQIIQDYKDSVMINLFDGGIELEHIDYVKLWIGYVSHGNLQLRPVSPTIKIIDYAREDLQTLISSIHSIESSRSSNCYSSYYYDLQGRRLSAPPARGMYIQDKRVKIRE